MITEKYKLITKPTNKDKFLRWLAYSHLTTKEVPLINKKSTYSSLLDRHVKGYIEKVNYTSKDYDILVRIDDSGIMF